VHDNNQKLLIADEAARILSEQSDLSFSQAKRKAAHHLGLSKRRGLPDDTQVEQALRTYQQLFLAQQHPGELDRLRQLAIQVMRLFSAFHPRLVGRVSSGSADQHSAIQVRLFCETTEEVIFTLLDNKIPWQERETTCHYSDNHSEKHPLITFQAGETIIELTLLPLKDRQNLPLSSANTGPEKGLTIERLEKLMAAQAEISAEKNS